ncbi:mitochondrial fission 1 protein-like [Corticium candelabrum]|uniref:mitochondrial fission 1 protein-like n=1 Tax=Corticium candelabrum TaxID=121492 RepID=UPI002E26684D|nr:mitochondrial fission 1 protein-like [Corticium candelabrum]
MDQWLDESIPVEELKGFERKFKAEKSDTGAVSDDTKFSYAWALIRSRYKDDVTQGISMMEGLCKSSSSQRDFLYFIACGYYRLEEYETSLKTVDKILASEPRNRQALDLKGLIKKRLKRDGLMGMAIVGGGVAVAAAAVGLFAVAFSKK